MAGTKFSPASRSVKVRKAQLMGQTAAVVAAPSGEASAPVHDPVPTDPAPLAGTVEAATSPAIDSDLHSGPADAAAPTSEGSEDMASMAPTPEATEKAQAMLGDVSSRFKTAVEKSSKMGEEMVDFAKGNVEAMVASARVAAKAGETIGQEAADYSRRHLESATAAFKSFATVKSPTELFQLQSEYAKASFDSAVAEASKLSESMMKFAGDIAQPLSNRYAMAAEKFKSTAL